MTLSAHLKHILGIVILATLAGLVVLLTDSPWAHAAWAPAALVVVKYLVSAFGGSTPPGPAPFVLLAFLALASGNACVHFPPGVNAPACGLDLLDDVGTVLVCNLVDHASLPSCVLDGLRKIATDHNCDVSGIVATIGSQSARNADATGDALEGVKAQRARAWLAAQPPNPADVPPVHDRKK